MTTVALPSSPMTQQERRSVLVLMAVFSLRMMGLFLLLPVFALDAPRLTGGDNPILVGLALGAFGLTQMLLHIVMGALSDRVGRKPVIIAGLALFALGALVASAASDIYLVIFGRVLQGSGAISSVLVALTADLTRGEQRTKAMAMIGGSIGICFALSLVLAPWLYTVIGMRGIFLLTACLAVIGMIAVWQMAPSPVLRPTTSNPPPPFSALVRHPILWRLNGVMGLLHAAQMALFLVIPPLLVQNGIATPHHWKIYLPVMVFSFVLVFPAIIAAERKKQIFSILIIATILWIASQCFFLYGAQNISWLTLSLLLFFSAFNILEAQLPSILSRQVPSEQRGSAMGLFSTAQSGGIFLGGLLGGGLLLARANPSSVFLAIAVLGVICLILCLGLGKMNLART